MEPWLRGGQGSKSQHLTTTACEGAGHSSQLRAILPSTVIHSREPATECLHVSCEGAQVLRGEELGGSGDTLDGDMDTYSRTALPAVAPGGMQRSRSSELGREAGTSLMEHVCVSAATEELAVSYSPYLSTPDLSFPTNWAASQSGSPTHGFLKDLLLGHNPELLIPWVWA